MLIESKTENSGTSRIRCGNCKSEYEPRLKAIGSTGPLIGDSAYDYSCPVCGHGKFNESFTKKGKQVLHD